MALTTTASSRPPKRPYQPSIAAYFPRSSNAYDELLTDEALDTHSHRLHLQSSHSLPDAVQISLLNVGMRVRKAVPEGYKNVSITPTTSTYNCNNESQSQPTLHQVHTQSENSHALASPDRPAELTPFCGLNKIGGFLSPPAPQPHPTWQTHHGYYNAEVVDDAAFPFSSQESNTSSISTDSTRHIIASRQLNRRKRSYGQAGEDREEEEQEEAYAFGGQLAAGVDPHFSVSSISGDFNYDVDETFADGDEDISSRMLPLRRRQERPMARAISSSQREANRRLVAAAGAVSGSSGFTGQALDFGEAEFLEDEDMGDV